MADIILAESGGTTWLVQGEQHMGDLLRNMLPDGVTVSIVACNSRAEAIALWSAPPDADGEAERIPWMINPAIVGRIKAMLGVPAIAFAPWSALLDGAAQDLLGVIAGRMADGPLILRQFCPAEAPAGLAELQRLRGMLVAAALAQLSADPAALLHETAAPEGPDDANRLELVIGKPVAD